jgi:uncharacterized protein (DUF1501 family)
MDRRQFLQNALPAGLALPSLFKGYQLNALAANNPLVRALMGPPALTDHVLVLIQLSGGNDGLNTVIPLEYYSQYLNARPNIYIPKEKALHLAGIDKIGLHPALTGLQNLYGEGKLNIIQSVGYPSPNFSHFRATDIWMTASASAEVLSTGWNGRFLDYEYPNYPTGYPNPTMPDPLGIRIGSVSTLNFQGPSINMAMSITNPTNFYNLLSGVQDPVPDTPAGKELSYVRTLAQETQLYAQVIKNAAAKVTQQSTYPANNALADQLKIVARLIAGGLRTPVYLVSYGSFDTHSRQVDSTDTTTGAHANLLQNLGDAIKAFQDDLQYLQIENRVMGMTFSEFGRRIKSNASTGTDHGSAAPVFVFGKGVAPGVTGNTPVLPGNASVNDNLDYQYDFRNIYSTLLNNWFCVDDSGLEAILYKNYDPLPLVNDSTCRPGGGNPTLTGNSLITNYPNPFRTTTTIYFKSTGGHITIRLADTNGQWLQTLVDADYPAGNFSITFNGGNLSSSIYYAHFQNGSAHQVRAISKMNQH